MTTSLAPSLHTRTPFNPHAERDYSTYRIGLFIIKRARILGTPSTRHTIHLMNGTAIGSQITPPDLLDCQHHKLNYDKRAELQASLTVPYGGPAPESVLEACASGYRGLATLCMHFKCSVSAVQAILDKLVQDEQLQVRSRRGRPEYRTPPVRNSNGSRKKIIDALARATRPLSASQIAKSINCRAQEIAALLFSMHADESIVRIGSPRAYLYQLSA